jgi:hypothetical protein
LQRLPELEVMLAKTGGKVGKVVEYTSYPEAYQDLALSRTDYVINTVINLNALVKEKPAVFECGDRGRTVGRDRHRGIAARQLCRAARRARRARRALELPADAQPLQRLQSDVGQVDRATTGLAAARQTVAINRSFP